MRSITVTRLTSILIVVITEADFEALLKVLSKVKGKFLLSSYPSTILTDYTKRFGWHQESLTMDVTVAAKSGKRKQKTEVLTRNY